MKCARVAMPQSSCLGPSLLISQKVQPRRSATSMASNAPNSRGGGLDPPADLYTKTVRGAQGLDAQCRASGHPQLDELLPEPVTGDRFFDLLEERVA